MSLVPEACLAGQGLHADLSVAEGVVQLCISPGKIGAKGTVPVFFPRGIR